MDSVTAAAHCLDSVNTMVQSQDSSAGLLISLLGGTLYFESFWAPLLVAAVVALGGLYLRARAFAHSWQLVLTELSVAADRMWEHMRAYHEDNSYSASELFFTEPLRVEFFARCRDTGRSAEAFELYQLMHQFNYNLGNNHREAAHGFAKLYYDRIKSVLEKQSRDSSSLCRLTLVSHRIISLNPQSKEW